MALTNSWQFRVICVYARLLETLRGKAGSNHEWTLMDTNFFGKPDDHGFETRSFPDSLAATHRGFTFYVADPISSIHG